MAGSTLFVVFVAALSCTADAVVTLDTGKDTQSVTISEGADTFDSALTVTATTAEPGATVTYAFKGAQPSFAIDKDTGEITIAKVLDFEANPTHTLTVTVTEVKDETATDQTAEATVTVTVKDVTTFTKADDNACVQDGAKAGDEVAKLPIADTFNDPAASYTVAGTGQEKIFDATAAGKVVVATGKTITKGAGDPYTLTIKQANAVGTLTLKVTVGDCSAASLLAPLGLLTLLMALIATMN